MNVILHRWSSEEEGDPSSGETLQDCAELVELLVGSPSSAVCDWRRKTESKNYQPGNVSSFRGEWHFFRGLEREREREKISVNLTKRLRTASILRDCAHVTGCVFWDGCFILCLLRCRVSGSWRLQRVCTTRLVKRQQLGLRTKKKVAGTRNFFSSGRIYSNTHGYYQWVAVGMRSCRWCAAGFGNRE